MGASYHPRARPGNVRPALRFAALDEQTGQFLRLSDDGDALEYGWAQRARSRLSLGWDGERALVSGDRADVRINGIPIAGWWPLHTGDILRVGSSFFRVEVEGEAAAGTVEQACWNLVDSLRCGTLRVLGGARGALEVAISTSDRWRLEQLERCPLAFEIATLDVRVVGDATPDESWRVALGALAASTTFIVPGEHPSTPKPSRLFPSVDLELDGALLALDQPRFLDVDEDRLRATTAWAPLPRLLRRGSATELSFELGAGDLLGVQLAGCALALEPHRGLSLVLMPGDVYELLTPNGTHVLRALPGSAARVDGPLARRAGSLTFAGHSFDRFVVQSVSRLEQFEEREPGRFIADSGRELWATASGRLREPASSGAGDFGLFDLNRDGLVMPTPSDFLFGPPRAMPQLHHPEALRVFIDSLLERQDGAGLGLQAFLEATEVEARGLRFLALLRHLELRQGLRPWASQAFPEVGGLPSEIVTRDPATGFALLEAVMLNEPMFCSITRLVLPALCEVPGDERLLRLARGAHRAVVIDLEDAAGRQRRLWPDSLERINPQWAIR